MSDAATDSLLLQWWRQRDDYLWRIDFLRNCGLLSVGRYVIAGIGATLAILAAPNIFLPPGSGGPLVRIGWAVVCLGCSGWAARWALLPWPTAGQSARLVVFIDILITLSALLFSDPNVAMSGLPLLLSAGGYVAFFHGPRLHLAHIGWCTVSVVGVAIWLASTTPEQGMQLAAPRAVIALLVTVCVLPAMQFGFWLLQGSSMQSLTDPLTELTNRRGLTVSIRRLAEGAPTGAGLCAMLIDIDEFKAVNDTHGHAVGDDVLVRTARRIRTGVRAGAEVLRWGGEEFLVLDHIPAHQAYVFAERIRSAVTAPAQPTVTVRIGIATSVGPIAELDELIAAADSAMYVAKSSGGNRVVVATGEALAP